MNAYDFDNTIFKGDSTAKFYIFSLKRHKKILLLTPSLLKGFFRFYLLKKGTKTEFKEQMYRFLTVSKNIEKDIEDFWEQNKKNIKNFYRNSQQDDDVIISASPEFLLAPICQKLGIKHLIASRVDMKTGKYSGLNCHGEEKVKRFREKFGNVRINEFYSDSYSDTPMAKIAENAFMVKNDNISDWKF